MASGFWGPPNSIIDFCEPNYAVSYYFAEFFNSLSSIPYFLQAILGLCLTHKYATTEFRFKLVFIALMLVGAGSFLFHASLQYRYQLLDELPMLLLSAAGVYVIFTVELASGHTDWKLAVILVLSLIIETILYLWFQIWSIFFIGFSLNVVIITVKMVRCYRDMLGNYWKLGFGLYYSGFMCWVADMLFCDYVQDFHLHSMWHLAAGYGSYLSLITMVIVRAKFLNKQSNVYLYSTSDLLACNKDIAEQFVIDIPLVHYCHFTAIPQEKESHWK